MSDFDTEYIYNEDELKNARSLFRASSIADENDLGFLIDKLNSTGVDPDLLNLSDFELDGVENEGKDESTDSDIDILSSSVKDTAVRLYLRDVGEITKKYGLLPRDKEIELAKRSQKGDFEARDILISSNLRLVIKFAKKFSRQGVAVEDLIQEGNLGLCIAADKYDYRKGFKFSTYATWWILQKIRKLIVTKYNVITVPTHVYYKAKTLKKATEKFKKENNRSPSKEELSEITGISLKTINSVLKIPSTIISLENHIDGDNSSSFSELLSDPGEKSLEDSVSDDILRKKISDKLYLLSDKERRVIVEHFFNGKKLQQIGDEMIEFNGKKLSRERVRQIRQDAIVKLQMDNGLKEIHKEME